MHTGAQYSFSKKLSINYTILPDCKLLRNKVVCHSDFFMHSWCAPFPKIIQKLDFVVSVLLILEQQRIERRRIPQEASFPWEGTDHRVSLVSGQRIWACMPLATPTLYGPFSVSVLLDLKLITNNIIRVYTRNRNLLNHRTPHYVYSSLHHYFIKFCIK